LIDKYKETEIGKIPVEWKVEKLVNITNLITKGTTPSTYGYSFENEGVNFLKIENMSKKVNFIKIPKISEECHKKLFRSQMKKNDILFSIAGSLGIIKIVDEKILPCNTNQAISIIRLINTQMVKFTKYILESKYIQIHINNIKTTGAQPNLSLTQIANFKIPIPPIEEQEKIASILSKIDENIENIENLIIKTKELKKGLMQELLTKGIGHAEYKETELGKIPVEWEIEKLKDICTFKNGKGHENIIDDNGKFVLINAKFISTDGKKSKNTNKALELLKLEDIAMVMSDIPNGRAIAKCYYIEEENKYTLNQRICGLTIKEQNSRYIFFVLSRNKYFLKFDDGVKQTNLRKDEVLDCPILIPPIKEQEKIANILLSVDNQIEEYENKKGKLKKIKKGLMQNLLTGKVRVKI